MAMKKVYYGPEGIKLCHILRLYDKQSLLNYAKNLHIRRTSGLKKDELAEKIANELLTLSVMRRRIAVFSQEQRALLERAMEKPFVPTYEEMDDALYLQENDYAFLNKQDQLNVPVDVTAAYERLDTPEFEQYARKMSWLAQCLFFGENFYGVFDKDVLLKVYNARKGFRLLYEELEKLCNEFPDDMTEAHIEAGEKIIISECFAFDDTYLDLLEIQEGKDFYIPNYQEVLDYSHNLYLSKEPAYEKLRVFFQTEIGMSYREADVETAEVWDKIQSDTNFQDIFQCLIEDFGEILDDNLLEKLVRLLQDANNHTRMLIHRGHTPNEMMQKKIEQGYVVQKPARSGSGSKKVYPNDPCPCGSGKKFKKCCGR